MNDCLNQFPDSYTIRAVIYTVLVLKTPSKLRKVTVLTVFGMDERVASLDEFSGFDFGKYELSQLLGRFAASTKINLIKLYAVLLYCIAK